MKMQEYHIEDLGYKDYLDQYRSDKNLESYEVGRVILEHKERYIVLTEGGELTCELLGNLRFTAQGRSDLPAVGDWVAINAYDSDKGLIHAVFPRDNVLERQAVGRSGEKQVIASNIDYGLLVQSVNRDYSINRLQRYITICHEARIEPIIILTKIDLIEHDRLNEILNQVDSRIQDVHILAVSILTGEGIQKIRALIQPKKTYCLLGSSGAGKSTLINSLAGTQIMKTGAISESIDRGKHITTHRELMVLESGGIIIDNPGMREVGITDGTSGLEMAFEQIHDLANHCKFKDCTHHQEKDCAVLDALEAGELNKDTYENYIKLEREQAHFSASVHEKRKKDKAFGKMVKQVMNQKKKDKDR